MSEQNEAVQVETVEKTIVIGKESGEVVDAVSELIKDIKSGKDVGTIAAESLGGLMKAIEGYDKLDDEMKHESRNATVAYAGLSIADSLS